MSAKMRKCCWSLMSLLLLFIMYSQIGCGDDDNVEQFKLSTKQLDPKETTSDYSSESTDLLASIQPYYHPLRNVEIINEEVPGLTLSNSDDGYRYSIMESIERDENGKLSTFSGVTKLEYKKLSDEERKELKAQKNIINGGYTEQYELKQPEKLGPQLKNLLDTTNDNHEFPVIIGVLKIPDDTIMTKLQRAIALGKIDTISDYRLKRLEFVENRQLSIKQAQFPIIKKVNSIGGKITSIGNNLHYIKASLSKGQINELVKMEDVTGVEMNNRIVEPAADVTGEHVLAGTQIKQFVDDTYDGEFTGSDTYALNDIVVAIMETGNPRIFDDETRTLVGYFDGDPDSTDPRVWDTYYCVNYSCFSYDYDDFGNDCIGSYYSACRHADIVHGLVIGDLRDDQDDSWTDEDEEDRISEHIKRSGYAGEARIYSYLVSSTGIDYNMMEAFEHVQTRTYQPNIVNLSIGVQLDDSNCLGQSLLNDSANEVYESGTLIIHAAGNVKNENGTDCTILSPGSAIGVFTVGGYGNGYDIANPAGDTDTGAIWKNPTEGSARGGVSWSDGRNRTIVDITAPACRSLLFDSQGSYTNEDCGTSLATPTVSAAAIDFIDWFKQNISSSIDSPGYLFANLLLMGDRQSESSGKLDEKFDELWGAGRLKMRMFNDDGMDSPWAWGHGSVCVGDGETVTLSINRGSTLSSDVDDFKAVIYWYDSRHEVNGTLDDIDLYLLKTDNSFLKGSLDNYDNKERVYHNNIGGNAIKLAIYGDDVTTSGEDGCNNEMRVYYAWFYEDDDRDDHGGPGSEIDPE